jgi:hypothetical protein
MNSTQQWDLNQLSEVSQGLAAPKVSQTFIVRESYRDTISPTDPIASGGNHLSLNLSVTVEVNYSPQSQRIINFLKCLLILRELPESALDKAVSQLQNIRDNYCQQYGEVQSVNFANQYSSFPHISSLVCHLEKDYENLYANYPKTIETAEKLINNLRSLALKNNWCWSDPLLNISSENEIVLEWWNQEKKLTIYVFEELIDYLKVWGADMDNEMEEGAIDLEDDLTEVWQWIAS